MGSSKSGSLDKFAAFSPAAALASGKVKLPETSLIGMLQANAEDDKVMQENNLANQMNFQNQQDEQQQYMQMLQQQMMPGMNQGGQVDSMKFLKQHLPYQDGGHVALRRKMFKMGGDVNTHGVGITSGLSFNQGGAVAVGSGMNPKVKGPDGQMREGHGYGTIGKGILKSIFPGFSTTGKILKNPIKTTTSSIDKIRLANRYKKETLNKLLNYAKTNPVKSTAAGLFGTNVASQLLGLGPDFAGEGKGFDAENVFAKENRAALAQDLLVEAGRFPIVNNPLGYLVSGKDALMESESIGDIPKYLFGGEGPAYQGAYEKLFGEKPPGSIFGSEPDEIDTSNVSQKAGATVDKLKEINKLERDARVEEARQRYADLLSQGDDRDKLAMLGDSLIAGGAALMEGEGYGAAAQAFNQPLSESRRAMEERRRATNQAAGELAISEEMQINAEDRAIVNEMIATGELASADQAKLYLLGDQAGASGKLPTDDEGKIDTEALENAKNIIYTDVTLQTGRLLVAFDSNGKELFTNDPEEAKAHASS